MKSAQCRPSLSSLHGEACAIIGTWPSPFFSRVARRRKRRSDKASRPKPAQTYLLAERWFDEIEGELLWDESLANNPDEWERLADRALQEFAGPGRIGAGATC